MTATGAGLTTTAVSVAGSIPVVGSAAATTITALSAAAAVAVPVAAVAAAGYGVYRLFKWLNDD